MEQKSGGSDSKLFKKIMLARQDTSQPHLPLSASMRVLAETQIGEAGQSLGQGEGGVEASQGSRKSKSGREGERSQEGGRGRWSSEKERLVSGPWI